MASPQVVPIFGDLDRHVDAMRLDRGELATDLMDIAVEEMKASMARQEDPDGNAWADLSESYAKQKARTHPGRPISELEGLMSSDDEMNGFRIVGEASASLTYGNSPEAKAEAEWFQDPANDNQPPRVFWGLTKEAVRRSGERVHQAFD